VQNSADTGFILGLLLIAHPGCIICPSYHGLRSRMIKKVKIENFMSIREETIELSPFTVFIGPNASGKSAIFKALITVSRLVGPWVLQGGAKGEFVLESGANADALVWQGNSGLPIRFSIWLADKKDPDYVLELKKMYRGWLVTREIMKLGNKTLDTNQGDFEFDTEKRGRLFFGTPRRATLSHFLKPYENDQSAKKDILPVLELRERIGEVRRYRPNANDISAFAQNPEDKELEYIVKENGWGLPLLMQKLLGDDRKLYETIEKELRDIFPHIRVINCKSERYGVGLAFTTDRSGGQIPASLESDGLLITLFMLWRLHTAATNLCICFEEPENSIHPHLVNERVKIFKRFYSTDKAQLLAATHSTDFLNAIHNQMDVMEIIRIVEFDPVEGTKIHKLTDIKHLDILLETFRNDLGSLWWSGAIGGVP